MLAKTCPYSLTDDRPLPWGTCYIDCLLSRCNLLKSLWAGLHSANFITWPGNKTEFQFDSMSREVQRYIKIQWIYLHFCSVFIILNFSLWPLRSLIMVIWVDSPHSCCWLASVLFCHKQVMCLRQYHLHSALIVPTDGFPTLSKWIPTLRASEVHQPTAYHSG